MTTPQAQTRTGRRNLSIIAILALFTLEPTTGFLTSDIANIIDAFQIGAGQATWVITIASLVMIPVAIIGGAVAGRWISYRALALTGVGIYALAGLLPLLTGENFTLLLVVRALWGLGAGLNFTLANSLIAVTYRDEQQRARMFGLGNLIFSISAVLSTILGGYLATISWSAPFLGYFVGVVAFVLILLFLREPEIAAGTSEQASQKARIPLLAWVPLLVFAIGIVAIYPLISLNSVVFSQAALGSEDIVGLVGSLSTIVGFFVSLAFSTLYRRLGRWVLPLSMIVTAAGMLLAAIASQPPQGSIALYSIAFGVVGAGMMGLTIGTPMILTTIVPPQAASLTQGLFAAALNLGAVISSFYVTLTIAQFGGPDELVSPVLLVSTGILAILCVPLVLLVRHRSASAEEVTER